MVPVLTTRVYIRQNGKVSPDVHHRYPMLTGYQLPHGSIPPQSDIVSLLLIDPAAGPYAHHGPVGGLGEILRNTEKY